MLFSISFNTFYDSYIAIKISYVSLHEKDILFDSRNISGEYTEWELILIYDLTLPILKLKC